MRMFLFHLVASTFYFKFGKKLVREMSSAVTHPKKHINFQVLKISDKITSERHLLEPVYVKSTSKIKVKVTTEK